MWGRGTHRPSAGSEARAHMRAGIAAPAISPSRLRAVAHFDIPLDLPHAGRLADRILNLLERHCEENGLEAEASIDTAERMSNLLFRYSANDENPGGDEAAAIRDE